MARGACHVDAGLEAVEGDDVLEVKDGTGMPHALLEATPNRSETVTVVREAGRRREVLLEGEIKAVEMVGSLLLP